MADILIVDDDPAILKFLTGALEKSGHQITSCEDGTAALELLQSGVTFNLLISDVIMPGIDGIELSRHASALDPALKIMFMTGFSAVALGDKNPETTSNKVMSKPFHLNELVARVAEILEN